MTAQANPFSSICRCCQRWNGHHKRNGAFIRRATLSLRKPIPDTNCDNFSPSPQCLVVLPQLGPKAYDFLYHSHKSESDRESLLDDQNFVFLFTTKVTYRKFISVLKYRFILNVSYLFAHLFLQNFQHVMNKICQGICNSYVFNRENKTGKSKQLQFFL